MVINVMHPYITLILSVVVNGLFSDNQQTIINWLDSDEDIIKITSKLVTFMAYTLFNSRSLQKWPSPKNILTVKPV